MEVRLLRFDTPVLNEEIPVEVDVLSELTADILDDISDAKPVDNEPTLVVRFVKLLFVFDKPVDKDDKLELAELLRDIKDALVFDNPVLNEKTAVEVDVLTLFILLLRDDKLYNSEASIVETKSLKLNRVAASMAA